jgi:hypothetical protein
MGSMILPASLAGCHCCCGACMVHSGIVRAFGSDLRRFLGAALRNRFLAFLAGILVTALLQSSTATGLMTASFVTGGAVDPVSSRSSGIPSKFNSCPARFIDHKVHLRSLARELGGKLDDAPLARRLFFRRRFAIPLRCPP